MTLTILLLLRLAGQQSPPAVPPKDAASAKEESAAPAAAAQQRTQINLLGQTDTASGESRRNENVQFNLIDTNTVKELAVRMGSTATLVPEFRADTAYFATEYGNRPVPAPHAAPPAKLSSTHGNLWYAHSNSLLSARSFFQVGGVKPARENEYGLQVTSRLNRWAALTVDGRQQLVRGQVNGNVLVPLPEERTPLATDPVLRAIVARYLAAYPTELPNRGDDPRALNTNAPQKVNTNSAGLRLDLDPRPQDQVALSWQFTSQQVDAFQLVAGQSPDTDTRSHTARTTWRRTLSPSTVFTATLGFDRLTTFIRPEPNAVGPTVSISNFIAGLGPAPPIPIIRAVNRFREAAGWQTVRGRHTISFGGDLARHQTNGRDQDGERGIINFSNDFGRGAITNLREGTPSLFTIALGDTWRGFRHWTGGVYAADRWQVNSRLTLDYGLRYELMSSPQEVNNLDRMPFNCDCNNFAPRFGFAYRLAHGWGRIRAAYGLHYGEIFATTFGQTRLSPPGNYRIAVPRPDLRNPIGNLSLNNLPAGLRTGYFYVSPDLATPFAHQYNFSWEPDLLGRWKLQLGYVGSRAQKLFQMWFENRARPVPGIEQTTATVNLRRPDPTKLEVFQLVNASRGYYDAARVTLIVPRTAGWSGEISYWFSKALDWGNDYTSTLSGADARTGRSQSESEVRADLKALTSFDQPHSLLVRGSYDLPGRVLKGWSFSGVWLLKNGTPFTVESGSDGPGFGNVDGQGSDRPHLVNPSILGRTIGDPDTSVSLLPASAFRFITPVEDRGSLGRNTFRRGKIGNINASLTRTWRLGTERSLEFRAESINLSNTPQFAEPNREVASPSFARITNTLNDGRAFRAQLRLRF